MSSDTLTAAAPPAPEATNAVSPAELISRGDKLMMDLRGIPTPEGINDVVDNAGNVTLPYIGEVKVEGMSTAAAEALIEKLYIDGGYYKKIDVIIVAEVGDYFVNGEVKREGKYPVRRDLTLLQAIAEAGGYTDFAKSTEIKIIRGDMNLTVDAERVEKRLDRDPLIKAGDIIKVPRRRW
jgi:protein involved in polysaccharide export with SLBB domain